MALDRTLVTTALPGYDVGDEVGRGGWGAVYRGRHIALGRDVAIKQLPRAFAADERTLDRFVAEARTIGQLDHPHVVKVYDFVSHEGMWLIVMEYLGGGTLWEEFQRSGVRADKACGVALAVCAGLEVAHEHGILHRDIKPENIMFSSDGTVRVCDFGIAKSVDRVTRHTNIGEVVGTPTYMSPEQAMGDDLDAASDVYSLGIVLYELLAGRLPFSEARSPTQQLIQHVSEAPIPLSDAAPDIPGAIADVVMTALEKRPADRFASAKAFGVGLARAAGESFGGGWLKTSGIVLMGGGQIQSAALRGPTMGAPIRQPTMSQPMVREDHFRPAIDSAPQPTVPVESVPQPTVPVESVPQPTVPVESAPQPTVPADPVGPGPTVSTPLRSEAEPPVSPPPAEAAVSAAPNDRDSAAPRRILVVAVLLLGLIGAVGAFVLLGSGADDNTAGDVVVAGEDPPVETAPTTPPTVATTPPTAPSTTQPEVVVPPTTEPVRDCPIGDRCGFIDSVVVDGDQFTIEWTGLGFEPVIAEGQFHVHFFWDIYTADQAGTNAEIFGVSVGEWELTDDQPFVSAGEMRVSKRPPAANRICVTVTNGAHAVVNPLLSDCVPIPEGV